MPTIYEIRADGATDAQIEEMVMEFLGLHVTRTE